MLTINLIIVHLHFGMQIKNPRLSLRENNVDQRKLDENKLSIFELRLCM